MFRLIGCKQNRLPFSSRVFIQLALILVVTTATCIVAYAQSETSPAAPAENKSAEKTDANNNADKPGQPKETKPAFTLIVTEDQIIGITLKAQDATVKEIAAELSKRLKIPIAVTPLIEKHRVSVNFSDLVLEPALQQLAPQVFIDYEIDTAAAGKMPRPLGIYLQGYNEPMPSDNAVVKGNSDVMIIEGDTEDTGDSKDKDEDQELKVKYEKSLLTVVAKKQPLVVVLYAIANELGVPLQVTNEVVDPISINIQKASVESALQQLGQNIRLYLRADLMTQERRPLRILLVGPDKKS